MRRFAPLVLLLLAAAPVRAQQSQQMDFETMLYLAARQQDEQIKGLQAQLQKREQEWQQLQKREQEWHEYVAPLLQAPGAK